jgi:hypothetical protein
MKEQSTSFHFISLVQIRAVVFNSPSTEMFLIRWIADRRLLKTLVSAVLSVCYRCFSGS